MDLAREPVGVFDLKSIVPVGLPCADGVLSLRSLRHRPVTIALAAGQLTLETAGGLAARVRRMRPLTIRIATGPSGAELTVYVAARAGGRRVWLLLDSGNGDQALVAPHVAAMAGLKAAEENAAIQIDGIGPVELPVRPQPIIYDGVLGARFMQDWTPDPRSRLRPRLSGAGGHSASKVRSSTTRPPTQSLPPPRSATRS